MSIGGVHNGVIAYAEATTNVRMESLIDASFASPEPAFFLLADELPTTNTIWVQSYVRLPVLEHRCRNSAKAGLTPVVQRVAMGGAEIVPVVREADFFCIVKDQKKLVFALLVRI